ncbi:MAG: hypothetical protein K8L99_05715 [Anaerolineae bacterium]|nr:hypothetical protein [Anaerolineae bacterium]
MHQDELSQNGDAVLFPLIQERVGIVINEARRNELHQYLKDKDTSALIDNLPKLPTTHPLWQEIIQIVSIGETYFFRNEHHFNTLRQHILPALIHERRIKNNLFLRIWNAGCATGEEPYSLAMLLRELIPDIEQWSITLLATDINAHFLDVARNGIYSSRSFRTETPPNLQKRWFTTEDDRTYRLMDSIKSMVTFSPFNLITDTYPDINKGITNIDLIMCRNVTIYFTRAETSGVVQRFYQSLNENGWLLVGHSEPQPGMYDVFETRQFDYATLYRKAATKPDLPTFTTPAPRPLVSVPIAPAAIADALPPSPPTREIVALIAEAKRATDFEDWSTALSLLELIEREDHFNAAGYYLRGLIHQHTGNALEAAAAFRHAIYCDPHFALAHHALGELYYRQGKNKQALDHWRRAKWALARLKPSDPIPIADDLTAEMLIELLDYRIGKGNSV